LPESLDQIFVSDCLCKASAIAFSVMRRRVNCWAHCIRLIDAELTTVKDENFRAQLRVDIKNIQLSDSERIFDQSIKILFVKWKGVNGQVDGFLDYFKIFIESKSGWYEGYSIGNPSHSNCIESSHKHFKCFENIKERTPCIKFMEGKGRRLVEEWSLQRSPTYTQPDGTVLDNPNVKVYMTKPNILTADWSDALKWDEKNIK